VRETAPTPQRQHEDGEHRERQIDGGPYIARYEAAADPIGESHLHAL
jgi:hypothetical protein